MDNYRSPFGDKLHFNRIIVFFVTLTFVFLLSINVNAKTIKDSRPETDDPKEVLDYVMDSGDIDFFVEKQNLFPSPMVSEILNAKSDEWEEMIRLEEERLANIKGPEEYHLTKQAGTIQGPSGKETYYNLDMSGIVSVMRSCGYSEEKYPYWIRDDGVKMLGDYVMVAAAFDVRPRGTIIDSSLGTAIVCDTGGFAASNKTQLDIATNW
jgi:hypothetical protein